MKPRTIVITGGSGKCGRVLVSHFLSMGDYVITTSRTSESAENLMVEHALHSERITVIQSDLTKPGAANTLLARIDAQGMQPDCLVNNARSISHLGVGNDGLVSREDFANEFLLDVIAPYELTMALAMQKGSQLRRVVNMGSIYGTVAANPGLYADPVRQSPLHYSVAKAALVHLTKELAVRLSPRGIQVNCVAFGGVEGRVDEVFKQRYARLCPMGRMLKDEEVVGPVDMLLSDRCSAVTGHTFAVDGGWSVW